MNYARYRKYLNTAIVSFPVSDALDGLIDAGYLTTDISSAALFAPLKFDPQADHIIYETSNWWRASEETFANGSDRVLTKFNSWYYGHATRVQKAWMSVIALMFSYDFIDHMVDDAVDTLSRRHRTAFIDCDDAHHEIDDFHALRDPDNIAAVLNLPRFQTAALRISQQISRLVAAPCTDFDSLLCWHDGVRKLTDAVQEFRYKNPFVRAGVSPKRSRKVLARSFDLLVRFFGKIDSFRLIHGEEIYIVAHHFVWGLKLDPKRIVELTIDPSSIHTPFMITLRDHELRPLCTGCVLWPGTAVLDQAVAFMLTTSGHDDEFDLFTQMNIGNVTEEGHNNPLIKAKLDTYKHEDAIAREVINIPDLAADIGVHEINIEEDFDHEIETVEPEPFIAEVRVEDDWCTDVAPIDRVAHLRGLDEDDWSPYNTDTTERIEPEQVLDETAFNRLYHMRVSRRQKRYRDQRIRNTTTQRVQQAFLDRLIGPPDIIYHLNDPEAVYWPHTRVTRELIPDSVQNYITKKRFS